MIAATDPQEFIPGGRQQALRHPGPPETSPNFHGGITDDFLLHRFEKVSIAESNISESWIIRKSPNFVTKPENSVLQDEHKDYKSFLPNNDNNKSHSDMFFEDSWSWKSVDVNLSNKTNKRLSDVNVSKFIQSKRFSNEPEFNRCESKCSSNTNKSYSGTTTTNSKDEHVNFKPEIGYMEEELYMKGHVVIWSKGLAYSYEDETRVTVCSYSSQYPIKHAIWATFYNERPEFDSHLSEVHNKPDIPLGDPLPSVCIIDSQNIRVFTVDNEDFIATLPFQVNRVWNTKFGVILEKEYNEQNKIVPATIFSLSHPLDEVSPIIMSKQGSTQIIDDKSLEIVFTSEDPSICMIFDSQNNMHSVYKIRRIRRDEWIDCANKMNSGTTPSSYNTSNKFKNHFSMLEGCKLNLQAGASPFSSRATSIASLTSHNPSRSHSPMAAISRGQTPILSPVTSSSPWLLRSSRLHCSLLGCLQNSDNLPSVAERTLFDTSQTCHSAEPILCFEHIWKENHCISQEGAINGPATKVFLNDDLTGQNYLCYFIAARSQLSIVKVDYSNENCMVFGMLRSISAKDAVSIPHLHMLAILEHSGNVVLYSGLTVVGKLHIGGVLAQHVPSPYVVRKCLQKFNSPFPRRSSLLPNCGNRASVPQFDGHLLSPVLPSLSSSRHVTLSFHQDAYFAGETSSKTHLSGLRDALQDRVTFQYSDGSYYRVTLPSIVSSPLVEHCLNALRQTMQRDATMTLLTRWYSTRNSPGSIDLPMEKEWLMFTALIFELLGYDDDQLSDVQFEHTTTPSCAAKRQRPSLLGSEADWNLLLKSEKHRIVSTHINNLLHLRKKPAAPVTLPPSSEVHVNTSSILFPYIKVIHYTLHLVYEDLKLNVLRKDELPLLAKFLSTLSNDLGLKYYVMQYWRDFPLICSSFAGTGRLQESDLKNVTQWAVFNDRPDDILQFLYDLYRGVAVPTFPFIHNVNPRSRDVVQLCCTYIKGSTDPNANTSIESYVHTVVPPGTRLKSHSTPKPKGTIVKEDAAQKVVLLMTEMNINSRELESYPMGVNFLIHDALWKCRENPPTDWPSEAYHLLQRPDLAAQAKIEDTENVHTSLKKNMMFNHINELLPIINQATEGEQEDGMEEVDGSLLKLRFSDDLRVAETRRLLQSSKPVPIVLVQRPDVSDHDFIEEQEKHLYAICTRTMSLPVGRGMFTLRTAMPVITEPLPIPPLCLTGKAPPRGTTVELTHIDTPANMNLWPLFHNGVANGLRIDPEASNIDSTWIVFNKPRTNVETFMEHAGFLMALGLNGHLKNLAVLNTFDYLVKFHEMTSVGVLLGLSAAFRGTSSTAITKMLSVHVEALLPPTSMELDVPQNLQVAALLGVGLVYQGTAHRHMTEVLLTEIGRPPGPEMENSVDRESYSLAAGLALGLVTLRQGGRPSGLSDLNVPDTLHYYMIGGNKRPLLGSQKDKYKVPSFQIREGSSVNLDVTAPGATLALGLMYLGTGNKAIADWMAPPETQYLLDFVRPDFLMLRTLSRALILWDNIQPEKDWIEKQVPDTIRPFCMVKPSVLLDIDYEAMNQAYCNIIAGACFALGLKYAGSGDDVAFNTLLEYCHMFTSLTAKSIAELAGKPTIETCLNVVLLSVSMVMAGSGNLQIMRIVRYLRRRVGLASSAVVTYGSHLAIHMSLGLLFLGGGRYTLSNSPASVAALVCAFYPKFPTHSNDNRYHLQAFRHLYVLAVEPRLVIPKDITMGRMCYANIRVVKLDGSSISLRGPGLIPDLNTLCKVLIDDERYWPVVFERERNWDQLLKLLSSCCCIDVKQRVGCLSYSEDKYGYRSQLAHTLTQSDVIPWDPPSKAIVSFSSDCIIRHFTDHFLTASANDKSCPEEAKFRQNITKATYDCVVKDKVSVLPLFINLLKMIKDLNTTPNSIDLWHVKMICSFILKNEVKSNLTNAEFILSLHQRALTLIDNWEPNLRPLLKYYILGETVVCNEELLEKFASYITFYDIPYDLDVKNEEILEVICKLQCLKCNSETVDKVLRMLNYVR